MSGEADLIEMIESPVIGGRDRFEIPRRAARLPAFVGAPADASAILDGLRILVIGSGAVGIRVGLDVARLQVAEMAFVDPKRFKRESLLTQEIGPDAVGDWKAERTARVCKAISPRTRVRYLNRPFDALRLADLAEFDVVFICTDNLAVEVEAAERCRQLAIPLIHASVHGATMVVHVRCLSNRDAQSPCLACLYGQEERELLKRQVTFSCDGSIPGDAAANGTAPVTVSTASLCGLAANLAVTQVLRMVLKLGEPVEDTILEYGCYRHRAFTTPIATNANCIVNHTQFTKARAPKSLDDCALAELAHSAGFAANGDPPQFTIGEYAWSEAGICRGCGSSQSIDRFIVHEQREAGSCAQCRSPVLMQPFFTHRPVSNHVLGPALELPLRELGAAGAGYVLIRNSEQGTLFRNPTPSK